MDYFSINMLIAKTEKYFCNLDMQESLRSKILAGDKNIDDNNEIGMVVECDLLREVVVDTGMLLLSKKALEAVQKTDRSEVNFLPVDAVFSIAGKTKRHQYFLLIPPVVDCIDRENSEIIIKQNRNIREVQVNKLRFKQATSGHIVRPLELPYHLFVSEKIVNVWKEEGFAELDYSLVDEFSDSYVDFID